MGSFANKNEALLDESRYCIVGREEEETDSEDNKAKAIGDALHADFRVHEHRSHHNAHDS